MRLFALTSCGSAQTLVLVYASPDGAICFHSVARDTCIGVLKWRESPPLCFVQDRSSEQVVFAIDERGRYMVTVDEEIPLRERWPAQPMDERTNRQITLCFWSRSIALEQDEAALTSTPAMSVSATVTLAHRDRLVLLAMRQADVFTLDESGAFYRWSWSKQPDGTNRAKEQTPSRPIYCAATTRLRSRTPFVRAVLSTDASVLVTVSRDGAVSVFALGESIRLLQMVHLLHLIDETVDLGQMNVSGVSKVSLDALDIVESGQLVLSVHGERTPSQLVVYDMRQERVLWRLPLAVQHLAALRPSATLKEAVASLDTPLDAFAAAIPAAQAVLIFRCLGEPVPVALWKLPLGSRPSVILTHPLVPLALVDEDAHLHIPSGPLGAPELTSTNAEQCDPCQRNRLSFWHEALPPAWYEQLPMPTPVDRKERPWSPTMYERSLETEEVPAFTPIEPFLDTLFAQFADASRHRTLDNDQTRPTAEALSRPNESVVVTSSTSKEIASISSETFVEPREWATVLSAQLDRFRALRQRRLKR
ncbi:hypothetical protein F1559_004809 [Cyanidiococcus yangmingshanensis]|uniref:Uncharacterized protein n=1 Tax=Cyanidiococcus yangmingshanensis TaxID=2690220 RepID=A0A7J7IS48_9RHOD|nr:hypothetical protein F1559_004809 [Cyanidiococcus yangmingshanensis]